VFDIRAVMGTPMARPGSLKEVQQNNKPKESVVQQRHRVINIPKKDDAGTRESSVRHKLAPEPIS